MIHLSGPQADEERAEVLALNGRLVEAARMLADTRHTALSYQNSQGGLWPCRTLLASDLREVVAVLNDLIDELETPLKH